MNSVQTAGMSTLYSHLLLKSTVFGVDLTTLTALEETTIPQFLVQGIKELEDRGLSVEGIYRVSGFSRVVKDMKERVDAGKLFRERYYCSFE